MQCDRTVLLEVAHPDADDARHDLAVFAELTSARPSTSTPTASPGSACGMRALPATPPKDMLATLDRYSKFAVPQSVVVDMSETVGRYGRLVDRAGG